MTPIIRFDNVTLSRQQKTLLSGVSFEVYPGQKVLIRGQSGAGKSSLLKTLMGMYPPSEGSVYFNEQILSRHSVHHIRNCTAYIGQEPVLAADTVREALLLPFQFKAHSHNCPTEAQLLILLRRLHLSADILDRHVAKISGGEKQRIALARGLLLHKTLYLLDEATSALDTASKQAVFDIFCAPQITLLAVTHDADWFQYSTTIFEMNAGRLTEIPQYGNP
ncbi:MAG: ABC transporter ATP-binding protein [Methylomonas sp.]|nr:ABC transporter ATP-binding protein [Methylomonas sp.]